MTTERMRDKVWKFALATTIRQGKAVKPAQVAEMADVSERTARETMNIIADAGWLRRNALKDGTVRYLAADEVNWTE